MKTLSPLVFDLYLFILFRSGRRVRIAFTFNLVASYSLILKRLGVNLTPLVVFPKLCFLERSWNPDFLWHLIRSQGTRFSCLGWYKHFFVYMMAADLYFSRFLIMKPFHHTNWCKRSWSGDPALRITCYKLLKRNKQINKSINKQKQRKEKQTPVLIHLKLWWDLGLVFYDLLPACWHLLHEHQHQRLAVQLQMEST